MTKYVLIGFFGLVGVFARYAIGTTLNKGVGVTFPFGTFLINLLGCFLIGVVYVLGVEKNILNPELRVALMAGLLGGFTTFSAYGLETMILFKNQVYSIGFLYFILSAVLGLACTVAGFSVARLFVGTS